VRERLANCPDLLLIEPAGAVAPVAGDERQRVAGVEQFDGPLDGRSGKSSSFPMQIEVHDVKAFRFSSATCEPLS
jgi:hypothetical protein